MVGGARRTRNRSRSDNVGGMAEAAPEEAPAGEDGEEVTAGEETTVSNNQFRAHYI